MPTLGRKGFGGGLKVTARPRARERRRRAFGTALHQNDIVESLNGEGQTIHKSGAAAAYLLRRLVLVAT